ncbi:hypothetical protein [Paenibacillus sp. Root52]|nr:hypothetical protein [Paenibacillus sp. Root52]
MNAVRKENINDVQKKKFDRSQMIKAMTKKACLENDEGLRRLSKN